MTAPLRDRLAKIISSTFFALPIDMTAAEVSLALADALLASEEWRARKAVVEDRPRIVCLCGSTRFWETFRDEGLHLTLEGKIVLSIGVCAPDSMTLAHPESEEGKRQKSALDALHKHKIDLADEVLVLNVGGYVGDSTLSEIVYALARGKEIRWLEPDSGAVILARLAAVSP